MERTYELDNLRRSLAMLQPQAPGLEREQAIALIEELRSRMERLRDALRELAKEANPP